MRASWFALHASLTRTLNRDLSEAEFREMGKTYIDLAAHASIASLMEHLHGRGGDPTARFHIIRTLVTAAQSDRRFRSTAQIIVILALWPGLDAVFWRLARGFANDRDSLDSEIIARVTEAILVLDLERVTAVTATVLRNVERDIRRDLIEARAMCEGSRPIDDDEVEAEVMAMTAPIALGDWNLDDYLEGLGPEETTLLRRIFVLGETQEEAGCTLGLSPAAARKRVQRSLLKLRARQKTCSELSHSLPPVGL